MSDFITSLIRTYVPIIVGSIIAWLSARGIAIDANAIAGLAAFLSAVFSGAYYLLIRILEKKYPQVGILLGSTRKPEYSNPTK